MKQILQNLKTGMTEIIEVPAPMVGRGQILIQSTRTILSAGTERMLLDFGKAGWIAKARQQPEKVKQVLDKIKTDGIMPTVEAVFNKLDVPIGPGYCNAGVVLEVGTGVTDLKPGDRVISNGSHAEIVCVPRNLCAKIPDIVSYEEAAFTVLASIALQGVRLSAPTLGEWFMVFGLGLVGLLTVQFLRASGCPVLAVDVSESRLRLAESFGAETVNLGKGTDPVAAALVWTGGRGVDGVLIAASAKGDEIVHQAAQACRKRGRIILVGVVDLNLNRNDFYEKEITFQVSCSYGPGRYDEKYEQAGQDYPFGFVRWTEQRNFEAVLESMRVGQLHVKELITHRLTLEDGAAAYDKLLHDPKALGIVIEYPGTVGTEPYFSDTPSPHPSTLKGKRPINGEGDKRLDCCSPTTTFEDRLRGNDIYKDENDSKINLNEGGEFGAGNDRVKLHVGKRAAEINVNNNAVNVGMTKAVAGRAKVGVIGAGNYAKATLLPALSRTTACLVAVADINGAAAAHAARKFGAEKAVSDYRLILDDPNIQSVIVLVGHHLHSRFVCEALDAGKHVFVEKPLAINEAQLEEVIGAFNKRGLDSRSPTTTFEDRLRGNDIKGRGNVLKECGNDSGKDGNASGKMVTVGFNRRFSQHTVKIRELLVARTEPLTMSMTVNAGFIPPEHWTQDQERGGGRIIGEGCHFIDLLSNLTGSPVAQVSAQMVGGSSPVREDKMSILLKFNDGSVGTVHYFANGSKSYPKETLEIFGDGRVIRMENFRVTTGFGFKGFRNFRTWRQDKGHRAEIEAFVNAVAAGSPPLIPFDEIVNATKASFAAVESARTGKIISV